MRVKKKHVYCCEECGILLSWWQVKRFFDAEGREHRVCIDCAEEKYEQRGE